MRTCNFTKVYIQEHEISIYSSSACFMLGTTSYVAKTISHGYLRFYSSSPIRLFGSVMYAFLLAPSASSQLREVEYESIP